ncbi:unnamed protein product [Caenorhabditis auriculariae]|uniref:Uncharacterized protein n=1 Tax=Caenorhabditis auriculariae TaxID=2777116 RepID=A0A8S1HX09_9PELO|nr:unnamed protein product [Caenorhabditis auriculariae]
MKIMILALFLGAQVFAAVALDQTQVLLGDDTVVEVGNGTDTVITKSSSSMSVFVSVLLAVFAYFCH